MTIEKNRVVTAVVNATCCGIATLIVYYAVKDGSKSSESCVFSNESY